MDALIWNIRSVRTMQAFERLITLNKQHHFEFIGIMEPKQQARKLERTKEELDLPRLLQMYPIKFGCS